MTIPLHRVEGGPAELEERVLERWRERELPDEIDRRNSDKPRWTFYEGPPTANGKPGVHHLWARSFKDLYIRYRSLTGHSVTRKGGWDCHGLPVELEVEKQLGLRSKADIERHGIDAFNDACRRSVQRYVDDWKERSERTGFWIDMEDTYWTMSNDFIESVWWLLSELWREDLLYEGRRVVPYCARCGTALSSHELGQPEVYREVEDPSVFVRMPIVSGPDDLLGADLVIWTTTPWTLPANVAIAVGPAIDYVRVPSASFGNGPADAPDLVIARDALPADAAETIVAAVAGRDLAGSRYRRPYEEPDSGGGSVVPADFVDTGEGSGLVHIAPAFGEDDAELAGLHDLPVVNPVDGEGRFQHSIPGIDIEGLWVKDADPVIIDDLEHRGLLIAQQLHQHSYPHCWRCQTPLIYWSKTSWFVRTTDCRDELLAGNETITWHPASVKYGRFGQWLEGNVDWALSRDRYWGTPLPIWRCTSCSTDRCISSVAELSELAGRNLDDLDLHRPAIDQVVIECASCGAPARRVPPVIDAWFDSGSMPAAQFHYPFSGAADFERAFPADFICEGLDQTRGWFYSLLAVNALVFDKAPFRNALCLSLIVDADGRKMSKSRGNAIDPEEILSGPGADALRWFFFSQGQPWTSRRISTDAVGASARETLSTLKSSYSFLATYANASGWDPSAERPAPSHLLDEWLIDRLDETVDTVTEALDRFDSFAAASALAELVDGVSNWYIRLSRRRFWDGDDPRAFGVLHETLTTISQLMAPLCPFLTDELYCGLTGQDSVHLAPWPSSAGRRSPELASMMEGAMKLVALGRTARADAKIKTRQPLPSALVVHPGGEFSSEVLDLMASELNVKVIEQSVDVDRVTGWEAVPNYPRLGPRLGSELKAVAKELVAADGNAIRRQLLAEGRVTVAGVELEADDIELRATESEGFSLATNGEWAVALDTRIDDELRAEGLARDLARSLNDLRKRLGYQVTDRVDLTLDAGHDIRDAIEPHLAWIAGEVLASTVTIGGGTERLDIGGHVVRASLRLARS